MSKRFYKVLWCQKDDYINAFPGHPISFMEKNKWLLKGD